MTELRHNLNETVPRDYTEQELRADALRNALSYFTYVTVQRAGTTPPPPPVGITTVLGIADHFAAYVREGTHPTPDAAD